MIARICVQHPDLQWLPGSVFLYSLASFLYWQALSFQVQSSEFVLFSWWHVRAKRRTAMMISIHKALLNQVSEDDGVVAFLAPYGRNALTATRLPNIHQSRRLPSHLSSHCQDAREPQNKAIPLWATLQARYMPQLCLMFDDVSSKDLEPLIRIDKQEFCLAIVKFTGWCCLWAEWELKGPQAPRRKWVCFWISQHWDYSWNLE